MWPKHKFAYNLETQFFKVGGIHTSLALDYCFCVTILLHSTRICSVASYFVGNLQ